MPAFQALLRRCRGDSAFRRNESSRPRRRRCRWRLRRSGPDAVTPSTRPPAVSRPCGPELRAGVKHLRRCLSVSIPVIGSPVRTVPGYPCGASTTHTDGLRLPVEASRRAALRVRPRSRTSREVASQAMHQRLRLRIAQANVELEHLGPVGGHHQAGIEKSGEAGRVDQPAR